MPNKKFTKNDLERFEKICDTICRDISAGYAISDDILRGFCRQLLKYLADSETIEALPDSINALANRADSFCRHELPLDADNIRRHSYIGVQQLTALIRIRKDDHVRDKKLQEDVIKYDKYYYHLNQLVGAKDRTADEFRALGLLDNVIQELKHRGYLLEEYYFGKTFYRISAEGEDLLYRIELESKKKVNKHEKDRKKDDSYGVGRRAIPFGVGRRDIPFAGLIINGTLSNEKDLGVRAQWKDNNSALNSSSSNQVQKGIT